MPYKLNPLTGNLDITAAPSAPTGSIQYNNNGQFKGTSNATLDASGNAEFGGHVDGGATTTDVLPVVSTATAVDPFPGGGSSFGRNFDTFTYKLYSYKDASGQRYYAPTPKTISATDTYGPFYPPSADTPLQSYGGPTYTAYGYYFQIGVAAYKNIGGTTYVSETQYIDFYDDNSGDPFSILWQWFSTSCDGYIITIQNNQFLGLYGDAWVIIPNPAATSFYDDGTYSYITTYPAGWLPYPYNWSPQLNWTVPAGCSGVKIVFDDAYRGTDYSSKTFDAGITSWSDDGSGNIGDAVVTPDFGWSAVHDLKGKVITDNLDFRGVYPQITAQDTKFFQFAPGGFAIGEGLNLIPYNFSIGSSNFNSLLTDGVSIGNLAIGSGIAPNLTNGQNIYAIGAGVFSSMTVGFNNTGIGLNAGSGRNTGFNNTHIGTSAGQTDNGQENTYIGYLSGPTNYLCGGAQNNIFGPYTMPRATILYTNVIGGYLVGPYISQSFNSVMFGVGIAQSANYSSSSIFLGAYVGNGFYNTFEDIYMGINAGSAIYRTDSYGGPVNTLYSSKRTYAFGSNAICQRWQSFAFGGPKNTASVAYVGIGGCVYPSMELQVDGSTIIADATYSQLGAQRLQNGDFAASTGWTVPAGWTITGGAAVKTNGYTEQLKQENFNMTTPMVDGEVYCLTFTLENFVANTGGVGVSCGGFIANISDTKPDRDGVYTYTFKATNASLGLVFYPSFSSQFKLRKVDLRRVTRGDLTVAGSTQISGGLTLGYVAKTANYTLVTTDYLVDCTANTFALTLPGATGITGKVYVLKNSGTGIITINTTASQTIDGNASGVLTLVQGDALTVMSNGANWIII